MDDEDGNKGPARKARLPECGTEALPIDCPLLASARSVELELASARSVELDDEGGRGTNDEDEDGPGCMDDEDENKGPAWKARLAECGTEALPIDCTLFTQNHFSHFLGGRRQKSERIVVSARGRRSPQAPTLRTFGCAIARK